MIGQNSSALARRSQVQELQRRTQVVAQGHQHREVDGGRDDIVGGLAQVDVVVGMAAAHCRSVVSALTFGLGLVLACLLPLAALLAVVLFIYYAVLAYQGKYFDVPVLTAFCRQRGWL